MWLREFDKKIHFDVSHCFNQPFQQKTGIEMGLYQHKHCKLDYSNREKWDKVKKDLSGFSDTRTEFGCKHSLFFKTMEEESEGDSEISRASTPTTGPGYTGLQGRATSKQL